MKKIIKLIFATPGAMICQGFYAVILYVALVFWNGALRLQEFPIPVINAITVFIFVLGNWHYLKSRIAAQKKATEDNKNHILYTKQNTLVPYVYMVGIPVIFILCLLSHDFRLFLVFELTLVIPIIVSLGALVIVKYRRKSLGMGNR